MQIRQIRTLSIILAALSLGVSCAGSVCIPLDLKRDSVDADLICVGRIAVSKASSRADEKPSTLVAEVRIDRVLKGDAEPGSTIRVTYPYGQQHFFGYDLVLLKKQGDFHTFSRNECSIPVSDIAYSEYRKSNDAIANLRWEMINSLHSDSGSVVANAIEQRGVLSPSDIEEHLRPRTADPDLRVRALALGACVSAGLDAQVVPALETVEKMAADPQTAESGALLALTRDLRRAQLKPSMADTLAAKLKSGSVVVRRLASFMLRQAKAESVVPHLKSALNDSDSEVRYNAVVGLALVADDKGHVPSMDKSAEDEQQYIDYWKKWTPK